MFPHRGNIADLCNSLFPIGLRNTETRYFVLWNELSESHSEHNSIEGMRTSSSSNINEVSVQVKYNNKQYRSRYDIHVNLCQQNLRRRRSRAVSRIPTIQIKRLLQKSKKVVIKVQKHVR